MLAILAQAAGANTVPRRAQIVGGRAGYGKCTIEVTVDGSAQVEIFGDSGHLTTLSGRPAEWRQFYCNQPLPGVPGDFRLVAVDGRGSVRLLREPRGNGGRALVHIDDPQAGAARYLFDFQWHGGEGGWSPTPPPPPPASDGPGRGGYSTARALQACQDAVTDRMNQSGYPVVRFGSVTLDNNPGRRDWVVGSVTGTRRAVSAQFSFSCSVDIHSARVRSVDVRPQRR